MPIESYKMGTMNSDEVILGGNSFDGLVPFELPPGQLNAHDFAAATAQWPAEMKEIYPLSRFGGNTNAPLAMSDGDCCVVCAGHAARRRQSAEGRPSSLGHGVHVMFGSRSARSAAVFLRYAYAFVPT